MQKTKYQKISKSIKKQIRGEASKLVNFKF